jgi:hypothetical protein
VRGARTIDAGAAFVLMTEQDRGWIRGGVIAQFPIRYLAEFVR